MKRDQLFKLLILVGLIAIAITYTPLGLGLTTQGDKRTVGQAVDELKIPEDFQLQSEEFYPRGFENTSFVDRRYKTKLGLEQARQKVLSAPGVACCSPTSSQSESGGQKGYYVSLKRNIEGKNVLYEIGMTSDSSGTGMYIVARMP